MGTLHEVSLHGGDTVDVIVRKATKTKPDIFLTVRGFSSEDVLKIAKIHGPIFAELFEQVVTGKIELDLSNSEILLGLLLDQGPSVLADIILIATDSDDYTRDYPVAMKLPVSTQSQVLKAIGELTFVDQTPGEFMEAALSLISASGRLLNQRSQGRSGSPRQSQPSDAGSNS